MTWHCNVNTFTVIARLHVTPLLPLLSRGHACLNRFKRQRNDTESGALLSSRTLELITWCHGSAACYVRVYVRMRVRVSMRMVVCT